MARSSGMSIEASVWQRRRFASAALRLAVTLVPILVSVEVSLVLGQELPTSSSTIDAVLRVLLIAVCSLLTLALIDSIARRFLPLAALLQLSLVFPDRTPSRFRTALKGGSGRRLAREVSRARREGLSDDPSLAAEQLLILATAIGDHDRRTRGHSERVRLYTELIAEELHLSDDERWRLQWAALIHDIGKITVPPEILNKKGAPDEREWAILKRHPTAGAELAAAVEPWLGDAIHAVGGHHERWDGGGYPNGIAGEQIPQSAAIVAVADAFEVMTAIRSYKKALPLTEARAELTRCAGTHFSPDVVRALLNVSLGRLRSSMGLFAVIAHLPFLGQIAKAASFAPNTVSTAAGLTTTGATTGVSVLALSGGLAVASTAAAALETPPPTPVVENVVRSQVDFESAPVGAPTPVPDATTPLSVTSPPPKSRQATAPTTAVLSTRSPSVAPIEPVEAPANAPMEQVTHLPPPAGPGGPTPPPVEGGPKPPDEQPHEGEGPAPTPTPPNNNVDDKKHKAGRHDEGDTKEKPADKRDNPGTPRPGPGKPGPGPAKPGP
jgi:HD-GYP domain-containing protein (c-di-GMP phosphodiesterase class II)